MKNGQDFGLVNPRGTIEETVDRRRKYSISDEVILLHVTGSVKAYVKMIIIRRSPIMVISYDARRC